jgi:tetrahydromethanopterin S-methyltransferase subunit E
MRVKHAIITVLVVWALIAGVAIGIAFYRHDTALQSLVEYAWGTSFAVAFIGLLFRGGAASGDTVERTEGVVKSSHDRDAYIQADNEDAVRGFAFGTIVMLSGLIVFCASLAALYLFFRK